MADEKDDEGVSGNASLESLFEASDDDKAPDTEAASKDEATGAEAGADEETKPDEETDDESETEKDEEPEAAKAEEKDDGASPASEDKRQQMVEATALLQERRRRQQAEEKLRKFESAQELQSAPDPDTEPDAYQEFLAKREANIEWSTRVEMSREHQQELHADFDEVEGEFMDLICDSDGNVVNHQLASQMRASRDPCKFLYEYMQDFREAETWSDPEKRQAAIAAAAELAVDAALAEAGIKPNGEKPEQKPKPKDGVDADEVPELQSAAAAGGASADKREPEPTFKDIVSDSPLDKIGDY